MMIYYCYHFSEPWIPPEKFYDFDPEDLEDWEEQTEENNEEIITNDEIEEF